MGHILRNHTIEGRLPIRNQHIIKSSIPTSYGYISPKDPQFSIKGTNFVDQHECRVSGSLVEVRLVCLLSLIYRDRGHGHVAIHNYTRWYARCFVGIADAKLSPL